jgi:hypothetical protein
MCEHTFRLTWLAEIDEGKVEPNAAVAAQAVFTLAILLLPLHRAVLGFRLSAETRRPHVQAPFEQICEGNKTSKG